jgi:hypothetical protein
MKIQVKVIVDSNTRILIYTFQMFDTIAVFSEFGIQTKPIGKRVWKYDVMWDKYNKSKCQVTEPILSNYIRNYAIAEITKKIEVKTWFEYEGK